MKNKSHADLYLWISMLVIGLFLVIVFFLLSSRGTRVDIYVDGERVSSYSLQDNRDCRIEGIGGVNDLVIQNGRAWIEEADCPDGLCVKSGAIDRGGQSLICLPHRVVIEIVAQSGTSDSVDYVIGGK